MKMRSAIVMAVITVMCVRTVAYSRATGTAKPDVSLYTMDCGLFYLSDSDVYDDQGRYKGRSAVMMNPCYLVKHGSDYMIWDMGLQDIVARDNVWLTHKDVGIGELILTMQKTLSGQLKQINVDPKKVKFASFTNFAPDHTGNARLFTNATLIIDRNEYARIADVKASYEWAKMYYGTDKYGSLPPLSVLRKMKRLETDPGKPFDIFGDGTVVIHPAPSLYPNGRMLFIRLSKSEPILLTGDTWHLTEDRKLRTIPKISDGKPRTEEAKQELYKTMDAIEKMAKDTGARVVIEHSIDDFFSLPAFPAALH
jgi:N-acyl homoserine lactone hydrolase